MAQATIIGGGLAGSEAAYQLAKRGYQVDLFEMRPDKMTPAHHSGKFAELVCSNSLRSDRLTSAAGLLKEELRHLDSLIIRAADNNKVPAGSALAVDREGFADSITAELKSSDKINIICQEVAEIPDRRPLIIATGPLTSSALAENIKKLTGKDYLYFYDAAAPIVTAESLNYDIVFRASRYDEDRGDYLNAPLNQEQFLSFWEFLLQAECHKPHDFERGNYFEGCLPLEVMAKRGHKTLLYGPMKPVGLTDPRTGSEPHAVVQLRQDNRQGTLYNMVGFQTQLKWGEQDEMLKYIPGMEEAEIVRYGVMHRNTYLNSPGLLTAGYQFKEEPGLFFAGQLTGVEGYIESTASGLIAGINAACTLAGNEPLEFPLETTIGSLAAYIADEQKDRLNPMNINFGLLPPLEEKISDKEQRNKARAERALDKLAEFKAIYNIN